MSASRWSMDDDDDSLHADEAPRCQHCMQELETSVRRPIAFVCMDCTLDLYTVRTSGDPEDKDPNRSR